MGSPDMTEKLGGVCEQGPGGKWMVENVVREEGKGFLPLNRSILWEQNFVGTILHMWEPVNKYLQMIVTHI